MITVSKIESKCTLYLFILWFGILSLVFVKAYYTFPLFIRSYLLVLARPVVPHEPLPSPVDQEPYQNYCCQISALTVLDTICTSFCEDLELYVQYHYTCRMIVMLVDN